MASALSTMLALLTLDESGYLDGIYRSQSATEKFTANMTKGMNMVGGAIVAGIGSAAVGTGAFVASSIEPAADLAETVSKTTVVFGESADAMLEWGKNSASALGMSQNTALGAASTYGNLFRAMDIGEESSATMSTGLVGLAADLASFNNMDPTEVLDKLRAGVSGESEPLKSLGININEALLKQRALEMGLYDGNGALDAAAKAQAAYSLMMEQTTLAQGDFARTSGGLANQQRILAAKFEDIKAKVGGAVLPLVTKFATMLSEYLNNPAVIAFMDRLIAGLAGFADQVVSAIPVVVQWFTTAFTFLQKNEGVVVGILAAMGAAVAVFVYTTVIPALIAMVTAAAPVILVMAAIGAAAYLLYEAWTNNWGGIQEKVAAFVAWFQPKWDAFWSLTTAVFSLAWEQIKSIFAAFKAAFQGDWYTFGTKLREVWDRIWTLITLAVSLAWPKIKAAFITMKDNILTFFHNVDWAELGKNIVRGIGNGLTAMLGWLRDKARDAANAALEAAKGFLGIHSPSTLFENEVGKNMALGMTIGFEDNLHPLSMDGLQLSAVGASASGTTAVASGNSGDAMQREIYKMLRDLPDTIARANRDAFEKARRE